MNDAGYTLVEMLVALVLVGLVMTGAATGARVVTQTEARITNGRAVLAGLRGFEREALAGLAGADLADPRLGPVSGDGGRFAFPCGVREQCVWTLVRGEARLRKGGAERVVALRGLAAPGLRYIDGAGASHAAWPADGGVLAAVALVDGERSAAILQVHSAQPASCNFDMATGGCGGTGRP
ncbi:prepilin-type N-terminal cleavage/methylation domain-containing protein [Phenylobacterium sp.]|uniref:prepilin-type N-terminal cleavage/methylation domain-containing protein n=1 Tax=Phenylobacterium sp. TaxID=1871053 RepID=UPI002FCC7F7E